MQSKKSEKNKSNYGSLAEQLMKDYDYNDQGELDKEGLIDMLTDAFKLSNKKLRVNKDDFNTLFKMMDKDGDGRVTIKDVEALVGKLMIKKEKEEEERLELLKKREEERNRLKSPLRRKPDKSQEKQKKKGPDGKPHKAPESIAAIREASSKKESKDTKKSKADTSSKPEKKSEKSVDKKGKEKEGEKKSKGKVKK